MITAFKDEYRFLSNFYPTWVEYDGIMYPSVENAYQASKTSSHNERIPFQYKTPAQAKRDAKQFKLSDAWHEEKYNIMYALVLQKFTRHKDLAQKLLATGNEEIVEVNTWGDIYWGVCNKMGLNKLGEILMDVRNHIKNK